MEEKQSQFYRELSAILPEIMPESVKAMLKTGLDTTESGKKVNSVSVIYDDRFCCIVNGEVFLSEQIADIECFRFRNGVGCVFAEYVRKNGDHVLFACGDNRTQRTVSTFVRLANRFLRRGVSEERSDDLQKKNVPRTSGKRALLRLIKMAKSEWKYLLITLVCFLLTTAIGLLVPYINRILVDDYIRGNPEQIFLAGFLGVIFSIFLANLLKRLISLARGWFLTIAGNHLIVRLREIVFRKIQSLSISGISRQTSGELMKRVNGDTAKVKQFIITQLPNLMEQTLLLLAVTILLFTFDIKLALLILIPAPVIMLAFRLFWRFMRTLSRRVRELNARGNAILHDIFSGIRVVKAYGMEKREEERFVDMAATERRYHLRQERIWAVIMPLLNFLMGLGEYVLLFYIGSKILAEEMSVGELSQISAYSGMIYAPLAALLRAPRMFLNMMTSLNSIFELLDEPIEVADAENPAQITSVRGEIELNHVSFGYEDADEILHDICLQIHPGEFVGLVGKSGVGKSTLINLIMRMYDVTDGSIRIDGNDIRDIPQRVLRSQMGVVLQENFLFAGTVWQNLTYAKQNADREEVIRAAKMAGAHEFIVNLPDGYQTYVGERGYTLSGGERQRIAIARALLHDPTVLILDEATSALDTETEKLIQDALQVLSKGRTTIAIAHRLSTLRNATRLVVLDAGRVAEVGTHEELMAKNGIYHSLVMAQREMSKIE